MIEILWQDKTYRIMCLFCLVVILFTQFAPGTGTAGRSTSTRSRVQRKIDEVVNTIFEEADALLNPHRKEPMPFVKNASDVGK